MASLLEIGAPASAFAGSPCTLPPGGRDLLVRRRRQEPHGEASVSQSQRLAVGEEDEVQPTNDIALLERGELLARRHVVQLHEPARENADGRGERLSVQ